MYDSVLIATDGSEHARRAAIHANRLAERFGATVHVLSVVDVQSHAGLFDAGGISQEFADQLEANAKDAVERLREAAASELDLQTAVVEGDPADQILEYATDHDVDVIVMGTHGRRGVRRFIAGSVTEYVVRLADVPVLTVPADQSQRAVESYDRILIPTDGSECANAAVEHALAIASRFDATVDVLNVIDVNAISGGAYAAYPPDVLDELRSAGESATASVADRARDAGVSVNTTVREGFPVRTILEYASEEKSDVIVMGTHGRSGLERFVLGSTTERILRRAPVPLLSVHAPDAT
ncbi:universal stress protein [Haloarculaceae archaeon H-GB2-1]|nr:universal stress protein [Haloarculaceae archaeon H-GB1-1]MEA5387354.1 universal stress protein [Haloarculaceae archaeon H-GB11]MEA5408823.1 universal stress protein [Haloarculaceae archaeon H-GB2-1]